VRVEDLETGQLADQSAADSKEKKIFGETKKFAGMLHEHPS